MRLAQDCGLGCFSVFRSMDGLGYGGHSSHFAGEIIASISNIDLL